MDDLKHIQDVATAAKAYAQTHRLGLDVQNDAAEIVILSGFRMGLILRTTEKQHGARTPKSQRGSCCWKQRFTA